MWNYAIPLLTAALALLQLVKDWGGHKVTWRRASVLLLIIGLGIGGMVNAHKNATKANEQADTINKLTAAVETANTSQVQNTKIFTESIERFSTKLSKLEVGIQTADLRNEADHLRKELTKTQKALTPAQAVLTAGIIVNPENADDLRLSHHVVVHKGQPVSFAVGLSNLSGVPARSVVFGIRICDKCKFHSETPNLVHFVGQPEYERTLMFDRGILSGTNLEVSPVEVDVPDDMTSFSVAFRPLCDNCGDGGWKLATINITRTPMQRPQ